MNSFKKFLYILFVLDLTLAITGYFILSFTDQSIHYNDLLILLIVFSVIAFTTVFLFLKGQTKETKTQTFFTLVAISLKFLLDLILVLIWFAIAKKSLITSVIIFFVLYLSLTLTSVFFILKELKKKFL